MNKSNIITFTQWNIIQQLQEVKVLINASTWMKLENIILNEKSQTDKSGVRIHAMKYSE